MSVSHDHPRFSDPSYPPPVAPTVSGAATCKGCGDETHSWTGYCAFCRTNCAICSDWLAGAPEMRDPEGRRIHVTCEATVVLEALPVYAMSPAALRADAAMKGAF